MSAAAVRVEWCGPEQAAVVHRLTQAAYRGQETLDPPSGTTSETPSAVRADLARGGGAIAWLGGVAAGCLRLDEAGDHLHVRRLAVEPALQRRGVGRVLMAWAEREAGRRGLASVTVGVRLALPDNLAFYRRLGYEAVGEHGHDGHVQPTWVELRKRLG